MPGSACSRLSDVNASSIARAIGRTSKGWAGSRPASGATMTLRTASVSASGSSRPSVASSVLQLGQAILGQAAKLQVGAARQVDMAVAQALRRDRPVPRAVSRLKAPPRGRTRTIRPSPLAIGRRTPGHQPLHVGHGVHRPASVIRRLQLVIDGVAPR